MKNTIKIFSFLCFAILAVGCAPPSNKETISRPAEFTRIQYNNPGLEVDLGVGLWAWPLPIDMDSDGVLDLIVSCTDKPYNGIYLFKRENNSDNVLSAGQRIGEGLKHLQASVIDGEVRI